MRSGTGRIEGVRQRSWGKRPKVPDALVNRPLPGRVLLETPMQTRFGNCEYTRYLLDNLYVNLCSNRISGKRPTRWQSALDGLFSDFSD
jgi:hypothetical protein